MAKDLMRKKYQKQFNKKLRALNKSIEVDPLWRGRFVFYQWRCKWWKFCDNSGGELVVFLRAYDKKTDYYKDFRIEYGPWMSTFNWHLCMEVGNTFIVEDVNVWDEDPGPDRSTAKDFTKVKVNFDELMSRDWKFS